MRQRAEANADGTASGSGNFVEFRYVMKARSNSVECLRDGLCVPIGNFNVWASLGGPRAQNLSKPIVLATATLDANALFHTLARGADAHASGLVALLVAADAVAKLGWTELSKLDKQIVVTFFNAETFDLIGSRSFVKDTSGSFKCERASSNGRFCIKPFRSDRAFENIALDKVEALLELSQVALEQQPLVFAHSHSTSAAHSLLSHLRSASASSGIEVRTPSNVSHRLPPSSAWSFVSQVPDIDAIVLAEHDAAYSNAFYHSVLDRNITANAAHRLCQLSTMTARTLLLSAGASNSTAASVSSNCTHIDELLYCLTSNFDCPLSRRLLPASVLLSSLPDVRRSASRGTSRYAGAYEPGRVLADLVSGATRLVFEQLQESSADLAPAASTAGANVCESASNCANVRRFTTSSLVSLSLIMRWFRANGVGRESVQSERPTTTTPSIPRSRSMPPLARGASSTSILTRAYGAKASKHRFISLFPPWRFIILGVQLGYINEPGFHQGDVLVCASHALRRRPHCVADCGGRQALCSLVRRDPLQARLAGISVFARQPIYPAVCGPHLQCKLHQKPAVAAKISSTDEKYHSFNHLSGCKA